MSTANAGLSSRQRGDFQTPQELARKVWATINARQFDLIIEPTFGLGSFLATMPDGCGASVLGWEIESRYIRPTIEKLQARFPRRGFQLFNRDVFTVTSSEIPAPPNSSVLVIGNPPWVTNAEQGAMGGKNTGRKQNLKSLDGLQAMTGKSNFDISEAIILHLVNLLMAYEFVEFAMLAKFTVLRNLIRFIGGRPHVGNFEFYRIDASKYFNAAVEAGLVKFRIGRSVAPDPNCPIYESIGGEKVGEVAVFNDRLNYDAARYDRVSFLEHKGDRHYVWRQGIKHDLKDVLELTESESGFMNGLGEAIDIEPETLYHLYKSSDIFHGRKPRFLIPIYQHDLKDDLSDLAERHPKLYAYLLRHKERFLARKSSIYKRRNPFTVFGVGEYTHLAYKIAVAGLYSTPVFRLLEPSPRPVIVDDTAYVLATNNHDEAVYLLAVLSLDCVTDFLLSISHSGDKRRFSKDVLARVLIPNAGDCPKSLLSDLIESWASKRSFQGETKQRLRAWLSTYGPATEKTAR